MDKIVHITSITDRNHRGKKNQDNAILQKQLLEKPQHISNTRASGQLCYTAELLANISLVWRLLPYTPFFRADIPRAFPNSPKKLIIENEIIR